MVKDIIASNPSAGRDYQIIETYEAGIELKGSEVKSLRDHRANLKGSFARIEEAEVFLYNLHISPYKATSSFAPEPKRKRKLLLHKTQIRRLIGQISQRGFTLIPLSLYFKKGYAKVELALCKGKRRYDKREKIKRKAHEAEVKRALGYKNR